MSGDRRVDSIKDLPSFKELNVSPAGVGSWQGLLTTAGTPAPMQQRLNTELNKILAMPEITKAIENLGGEVKAGPSADLANWIESNPAGYAAKQLRPHPARLRFGGLPSPQGDHKGEGRLGREPSCKATERVARAVSTSTG